MVVKRWHFINQLFDNMFSGKAKLYAMNVSHSKFAQFPSLAAKSHGLKENELTAYVSHLNQLHIEMEV